MLRPSFSYPSSLQIVGIFSGTTSTPSETFTAFREWISRLMSHGNLCNSTLVLCPENNYGWEAFHITAELLTHMTEDNLYIVRDNGGRPGVRTTNDTKHMMVERMVHLIHASRHNPTPGILFWEQMVCMEATPDHVRAMEHDRAKEILCGELEGFSRVIERAKKPENPPTIRLTGKMSGKDDHLLAFGVGILCHDRYIMEARMERLRHVRK